MNKIHLSLSLDAFKVLEGMCIISNKPWIKSSLKTEFETAFQKARNEYDDILINNIVHHMPSKVREDLIELLTPIAGKQRHDGVLESLLISLEEQIDEDELGDFEHEMLRDFENEIR